MSWWSKVLGLDEAPAQQGKQAKRSKKATPSKKEVSGKCDICNKPASTAKDGKVFTSIEMQRATKRGFNAYASGGPAHVGHGGSWEG